MKEPRSIRYYLAPHEGERSAAATRASLSAALRELFSYTAEKQTQRSLGAARLPLEELAATAPDRAAAFSALLAKRRALPALFYADAGDCLGDGEMLVRSILLGGASDGEGPFAISSSAPAVLPHLLCHFGVTSLFVAGDPARIKAPVCCENGKSYEWKTPDGSACTLMIPLADEVDRSFPALHTASFSGEQPSAAYTGELALERADAADALAGENRRAADLILYCLEPLSALFSLSDKRTDLRPTLDRMTRTLLKNMAVTDTARLSPAVYRHRLDRAAMLMEEGEELLHLMMRQVLPHRLLAGEAAAILLFSPYTEVTAKVLLCHLALASDRSFSLRTAEGEELAYEILEKEEKDGFAAYTLRVLIPALAPLAFSRISVIYATPCVAKPTKKGALSIKNRGFFCEVTDGRLKVTCLRTGRVLQNPVFLEDQGDRGTDGFLAAQEGSQLFFPGNWRVAGDALAPALTADILLDLPACYDRAADERSAALLHTHARLTLTAEAESDLLSLRVTLTDPASDHRLRLAVRSELVSGVLATDVPFDCRVSEKNSTVSAFFARISREDAAFAVLTDTRRALERVNDTLYITLSHRAAYRTETDTSADMTLALVSDKELTPAQLYAYARLHRVAPPTAALDCLPQSLCEYPPRITALPFSFDGEGVVLTAVRRRACGEGVILHLLNTGDEETELQLTAGAPLALSTLAEREALPLSQGGRMKMMLAPHQILSLILQDAKEI